MHGFVRDRNGNTSAFDPPGSLETIPTAINDSGQVVGRFMNSESPGHGFLRNSDGTFDDFDLPGSFFTNPNAINNSGEVVGYAVFNIDSNIISRGFVRDRKGKIIVFDAPGAFSNTGATGIDPSGNIVGYVDSLNFGGPHAFVRNKSGSFVVFDAPDSSSTTARGINASGRIVGDFSDLDGFGHGFLAVP